MRFNFFTTINSQPFVQDKTEELIERLSRYRRLSAKVWEGWNRHHSLFVQELLDKKHELTFDLIKQKFVNYVHNQQGSIFINGDFAELCRFLHVDIPESAIQKESALSTFFLYLGLLQQGLSAEPKDMGAYPIGF